MLVLFGIFLKKTRKTKRKLNAKFVRRCIIALVAQLVTSLRYYVIFFDISIWLIEYDLIFCFQFCVALEIGP
jgi:hypothetical protein